MARPNKIWFYKATGWWCVIIEGKRIRLAEGRDNKKAAERQFHRLTTERNARRAIYRAFSWACSEGILSANPLLGMKCPRAKSRQRVMTDEEFRLILRESNRDFKTLMFALRETGCRPKEARTLTWDCVKEDRWVLAEHKTAHATGTARNVFLTLPMRKLMALLRRTSRTEHVFVNARGNPWTVNAMRLRLERIKKNTDLPEDCCPYLLRHAWGTQAILNGVDVLSVAQLMGHRDLTMIQRVYVHLADKHEHLRQAMEKARRPAVPTPSPDAKNPDV